MGCKRRDFKFGYIDLSFHAFEAFQLILLHLEDGFSGWMKLKNAFVLWLRRAYSIACHLHVNLLVRELSLSEIKSCKQDSVTEFTRDLQLQLLNLLICGVFDNSCKPFAASQQPLWILDQSPQLIQDQMWENLGSWDPFFDSFYRRKLATRSCLHKFDWLDN